MLLMTLVPCKKLQERKQIVYLHLGLNNHPGQMDEETEALWTSYEYSLLSLAIATWGCPAAPLKIIEKYIAMHDDEEHTFAVLSGWEL